MAIELSLPVGGVIPWIGDLYGITLPDNYMVLDGDTLKSLPDESPFKDNLNLLLSMEGRTFHAVDSVAALQEHQGDEGYKSITIKTENIPTDYGYGNGVGASYTGLNNAVLGSGKIGASSGTYTLSTNAKFPSISAFLTDETSNTVSGTGYKRIYGNSNISYYNSSYGHYHKFVLDHAHKITAKSSYTPPSATTDDSFGNLGSGTAIDIPTKATDFGHAKCKFIIRLW